MDILLKLILNIRNAANVVLHTAISLFSFLLFNWEKFKARRGVLSFLCYLTKNYSYFELLLQYLLKNVECLKNNYQKHWLILIFLRIIFINPVFVIIIIQK